MRMSKHFLVSLGGRTKPIVFENPETITEGLLMQVFTSCHIIICAEEGL